MNKLDELAISRRLDFLRAPKFLMVIWPAECREKETDTADPKIKYMRTNSEQGYLIFIETAQRCLAMKGDSRRFHCWRTTLAKEPSYILEPLSAGTVAVPGPHTRYF
ncbi:hypothetical protein [uncultured Desulfobacter sp.]|uniref:hypothetical protein n=1 Tax=uncultured Desulfobacter sp. TaxID=240139 RepID=UPI0029F59FDC|nr:hypothetical protein [uncultured Desulfobacter sp.]